MKPLILSVQAFGPFAGEQILDFTQLGQNPLFLINGATGAGKSTLLDAMCFALYGQTSGNDRDATQMRCDHATHQTLTQVTLYFCVKGKDYKVERIPQQERKKARGEGTTTQTTEANLWQIDNNQDISQDNKQETIIIAKSAQKVTQYITELMGLTLEQFRQVMILPQGRFREFLLADSSAREKIFSTLFQTHIYQRLEEKLKDAAKNVNAQYELLKHDTTQLLAEFESENTETLKNTLHAQQQLLTEVEHKTSLSKNTLEQHQKALELANTLAEEFKQLALKQQQLTELKHQATLFENKNIQLQQNEKAKTIKPDYTHFERIEQKYQQAQLRFTQEEQNLQQIKTAFTAAQNQLAKAQEQSQALPKIQEQLRDLTALLPQIDQLHTTQKALNTHQKSMLAEQEHCNTLAANIHHNEQQLENNQQKIIELKDNIAQLPTYQAEFERQKNLGVQIKQCNELNKRVTQQQSEIDALNNTLKTTQTDCENKSKQLKEYEYLWHSQQAAILAQQLQHNTPCLVCGSTSHPNPANSTAAKLVDVTIIDQQKQLLDNATQELHKQNITLAQLKAEYKSNSQRLAEITQALAGDANTNIDQLRESCQKLSDQIKTLKTASQNLPQLMQQEKTLKNQINNDRTALEKKQEAFNQVQTKRALAQAELNRLEQLTPINQRDKATVNQTIKQYESAIAQTEQQLQSAQKNFDDVNIANVKQQQLIHELQAALKLQQTELNQAKTTWLAQLKSHGFKDTQDFNKAQLSIEQALTLTQEIEHYTKSKNELSALINAHTQKLKNQTPPNTQALKTEVQISQQAYEAQLNLWQQQKSLVDHINNTLTKLDSINKKAGALEEQHRLVGTLAQCASGKSGKRISLQRFVLGVLLDDVLIEASERLIKMSKGRYRLLRNLERTKGNSASGLDLLIEDNHTGKTRSTATLSGGESFLAALALALGLTDVVHAYAGGVQLDALFIDEGFGSLDQEALDLALQTLIDLQHSGKMIGIISHVSELKEQMALRVDITSSANGSEIKLKI